MKLGTSFMRCETDAPIQPTIPTKSDRTNIKFMPWDKKAKKSMKNSNGQYEDQWVEVPAFSLSFVRNGNQSFVIGLEPGETETVIEFLRFYLKTLFSHRFDKQILEIKKSKENG